MQAVLGASVLGRGQAGSLSRPTSGSSLRVPSLARPSPRHDRRAALAPVAAAPAAVAAAAAALTPAAVFDVTTVLVLPFYAAMIAAPGVQLTQRLFSKAGVLTAAAALYGLLLALWRPLPAITAVVEGAAAAVRGAAGAPSGLAEALRSALPSVPAFAALFGSAEVTAVAWVHLLVLDLLQARWVYKDGQRNNIPVWHSAVLCFMVGPLGLLCHLATKAAVQAWRGRGQPDEYVVYRF